jgi:hypothetical protein
LYCKSKKLISAVIETEMSLRKSNPSNQPDRIYLSSDDADEQAVTRRVNNSYAPDAYATFTVNLRQPVIKATGIQLNAMIQPNSPADGPNIPDYQAVIGFMYYKQSATNTAPVAGDLRQMYLVASSQLVQNTPVPAYANRYYSSYTDFVAALNAAATFIAAGPAGGPDIEFYYDATLRKIAFRGLDNTKYYMAAGYDDPLVTAAINATWPGLSPKPLGLTLNLRCGFNNQFYSFASQALGGPGVAFTYPYGYPNLVRTGAVTLRTNFNFQSSIDSKDNRDVLAVVPMQVPFLGVNEYSFSLNHYLTSVPETIQQITINMFDENGQPYYVGNNVNTVLELLVTYAADYIAQ